MNRFFSVIVLSIICSTSLWAQDTVFARKALETLCSKSFAGRGYVHHGQEKAASWIFSEFQKGKPNNLGIQEFEGSVVVFPKNARLSINGKTKKLGFDWLPQADAPSIKGEFQPILVDSTFLQHPSIHTKNSILVAPSSLSSKTQALAKREKLPVLIQGKTPPLWTVKQQLSPISCIYWKNESEETVQKVSANISSKIKQHTFQNVWAVLLGKSDSIILISAHYDHLGQCGPVMFPGANDNASGTAMMLDLYHHLSREERNYTVIFCAFSGEEAGLLGSTHFVKNPPIPLNKLKFVVNLDLMATGEDGITVVNAVQEKEIYQQMLEINQTIGLKAINSRINAPNSDHYPFTQAGYRAIFIYAQGQSVKAYHHPDDVPEKALWKGYHQIFKLIYSLIQ